MNKIKHKTKPFLNFLPFALSFILGSFFILKFVNHMFFYQEKSSLFIVSLSYLLDHLKQPGGFLIYLGTLQTSFYYYPMLGAVIVLFEICGIMFLLQKIGKTLTSRNVYLLSFLIGALLFFLQTNYQYQAFNTLGIFIQLLVFFVVIRFSGYKNLWVTVFFSPAFYFLFGSFSYLFLLLFSIFLIQKRAWEMLIETAIFCSLFFFIGKEYLFFQTTETLYKYPFNLQDIGGQVRVFEVLIGIIVLFPLLVRIEFKKVNNLAIKSIRLVEVIPILIIAIMSILMVTQIDKKNSHYFKAERLFYEQKYEELIEFNSNEPSTNLLTIFLNNVALAETGQLTESFFAFPQSANGGTLFLKWEIISEVLKCGGYFYYSIGMINEAQRWAYEYMVMRGNSPEVLKMMIKTDLIKGKYLTAEKYISILEKTFFYKKYAQAYKKLLFNDVAIEANDELERKKQLDIKQDFFVMVKKPYINLDMILESDSLNIPAIEYKLAWLMLKKDMKGVVKMLPMMENAGYKRIPKNVEEVVATYKLLKVGEMPALSRLKINTKTEQRFQQFYQIFQKNSKNKLNAQRALYNEFSDTYWYYVFFN